MWLATFSLCPLNGVGRLHNCHWYKEEGQGAKAELCCHLEMRLDQKPSLGWRRGEIFPSGIHVKFWCEFISKDKQGMGLQHLEFIDYCLLRTYPWRYFLPKQRYGKNYFLTCSCQTEWLSASETRVGTAAGLHLIHGSGIPSSQHQCLNVVCLYDRLQVKTSADCYCAEVQHPPHLEQSTGRE